jgi:fibrillarin-like rRNA methylase
VKVVEHDKFKGVYWIDQGGKRILATKNIVPGFRSYDETVRIIGGRGIQDMGSEEI